MASCCKRLIFWTFLGFGILLFAEYYVLPLIVDYFWPVPNTSSRSLEAIIKHRIELRDLETDLDQMLRATNNPVHDHAVHAQIEIVNGYDKIFTTIEKYTTNDYGVFDIHEIKRLLETKTKISNKIHNFFGKHKELYEERKTFLASIAQRVEDVGQYSKSRWILMRNMDILAERGIILDLEEQEGDFNADNGNSEEDDACLSVLQEIFKCTAKGEGLVQQAMVKAEQLMDKLNEDPFISNKSINVEQEFEVYKRETKRVKSEIVDLVKNNRVLIGKTNTFIMAARTRVNALVDQVMKKENDFWMAEVIQSVDKIHEQVIRSGQLTEKLNLKIQKLTMDLKIATVILDEEANHDEL